MNYSTEPKDATQKSAMILASVVLFIPSAACLMLAISHIVRTIFGS